MKSRSRFVVVLRVLVALGAALLPYVTFPAQPIGSQNDNNGVDVPPGVIHIASLSFVPARAYVVADTTVQWTNDDPFTHTVTSNPAGLFDSGPIHSGGVYTHTFAVVGVYNYVCTIHPSMHGTIVVAAGPWQVFLPLTYR